MLYIIILNCNITYVKIKLGHHDIHEGKELRLEGDYTTCPQSGVLLCEASKVNPRNWQKTEVLLNLLWKLLMVFHT